MIQMQKKKEKFLSEKIVQFYEQTYIIVQWCIYNSYVIHLKSFIFSFNIFFYYTKRRYCF